MLSIPQLTDLPAPEERHSGWPWTRESLPVSETMPDGAPWPRISIVTPSFNQGQFIEETIRSVLLQGYPNLEYIIIDGGSNDNSVDIIRKYDPWLTYWVSEPDRGQSHAINKGFTIATGEIVAWINSDDTYERSTLPAVANALNSLIRKGIVYGNGQFIDEDSCPRGELQGGPSYLLGKLWTAKFVQHAAFIHREVIAAVGLLSEEYDFCMDQEYWLRASRRFPIVHVPNWLVSIRSHDGSKGARLQTLRWEETVKALKEHFESPDLPFYQREWRREAIGQAHWLTSVAFWRAGMSDDAVKHAEEAVHLAPTFAASEEFGRHLVGTQFSSRALLSSLEGYFYLLPTPFRGRRHALRKLRARAFALLAFEPGASRLSRARSAWIAIALDPLWLQQRNVARQAIEPLLGFRTAQFLASIVGRQSQLQ